MRTMIAVITAVVMASAALAADDAQPHFKTPEEAMRALVAAARKHDTAKIAAILGPGSGDVVDSGDPVADEAALKRFVGAASERTRIGTVDDAHRVAILGRDDWPFPIPLVKDDKGWRFDTAAGRDEIINRRVGRNELAAIATARAFVQAQREYATSIGQGAYAQKVHSTPGQHDGLYWEDADGKATSPLGPLVAEADAEGYAAAQPGEAPRPFHGYYFRILTAQGAGAPGGAKSYVADGKLTGGFALVAWPADYGNSGVQTFVVNQQGIVFQKDLGAQTDQTARAMTAYDPDGTWTPVR
jgi:hypothetical protein